MRILQIISSSGLYGAENVLLNLSKLLKEDGHYTYLICLKNHFRPDPKIHLQAEKLGVPSKIISCRNKFDLTVFNQIRNFIKQECIEIIHSHGYKSNFYGLISAGFAHIPIVATIHGWTRENRKIKFYEGLDRHLINKFNHLVSVSPVITEELKRFGLNGNRVTFIPNGIDIEKFNPTKTNKDIRKELGLNNCFVIGNIGRLNPEKGHIYLIKALEKIIPVIPQVKLLIIGDGPLRKRLQEYVDKNALSDKVIFTGIREDLPELYKAMDIFVLPSVREGIPMAMLEAMAMQVPLVASNVGGVPYVLNSGEYGILASPGNSSDLADKITLLLKNEHVRFEMGQKAREKIVAEFTDKVVYGSYLKVYQELLERN